MKRSNIPKEKTSNNLTYMNHHALSDDDNSELIKSLSVEETCDRAEVENREITGHIYENVRQTRVGKKKYKSLSELVGNWRSRTRDLKLKSYAKKLKTKMIENQAGFDKNFISSSSSTICSDYQRTDEEDDLYSYTSCQEENIYENLNFDFQHNWNENETVLDNNSLKSWLDDLTTSVVEYESDNLMVSKCIPSRGGNFSCTYDFDFFAKPQKEKFLDGEALDLENYKLDIVNKCFAAVWKQESENEILNNLYVFLNDIFSSFFRRNAAISDRQPIVRRANSSSVRKRRKHRETSYDVALKSVDKKAIQKLETFILSVTLNRRTITYDNCLKFYSALESGPNLSCFGGEVASIIKFSRYVIGCNLQWFGIHSRKQLRHFLKTLRLILVRSVSLSTIAGVESPIALCDASSQVEKTVTDENIYQPIWKWRTDCKSANLKDNIYASLDFVVESDDNDWEIDSEFCFLDAKDSDKKKVKENMFKTVCILYSDDNPRLNKILYSYDSSSSILKDCLDSAPLTNEWADVNNEKSVTVSKEIADVVDIEFESVRAWKNLIRSPLYLEDEEDIIMSETQISSLQLIVTSEKGDTTVPVVIKASDDNEKKEPPPKSKLIPLTIGSYELKSSVSESSIETVHGNYRNLNENDTDSNNTSLDNVDIVTEEPKRERFRDKMKEKFKFKSSKPTAAGAEIVEVAKEVEEEFFSSSLELVAKDSDHKHVPKVVVECVSVLEQESNIQTPGLYRVSGNKTQIEAFKKKHSDKKSTKKESKHSSLRNQDVHCVTGILKMFFRELSPSLMPSQIFMSCTSDDVTNDQIAFILKEMPLNNYQTLKFLLAHLKKVEQNQAENLMDATNLAICWGLCLFSSSFDTTNQFFENNISKCNMLCKKLIDHFEAIFKV